MTLSVEQRTFWGSASRFSRSRPILMFLVISFTYSWLIWLAAIPFAGQDKVLLFAITNLGGYGPALGAVLTLSLQSSRSTKPTQRRLGTMAVAFGAILAVQLLTYRYGSLFDSERLPDRPPLTVPVAAVSFLASVIGAWIISSARAENPIVRERMYSLLPAKVPLLGLGFAVFYFATTHLISWGFGSLLSLPIDRPPLLMRPAPQAVSLFLLVFALLLLVKGGIEEPGWRGFMLPELQQKHSPLMSSLIVAPVWAAWHIPLFLIGWMSVKETIAGTILVFPMSILCTWLYNKTGGNVFLLMLLHSAWDSTFRLVPASAAIALVIRTAFIVFIVLWDRMYQRQAAS